MREPSQPAPLLPAPLARLAGFVGLATLGVLQWQRMVEEPAVGRALGWVAVGAVAGLGVLAADRLPQRARGWATLAVAAAGVLAAYAAAGLDLGMLKPRRWDELGDGVGRGLEALGSVRLPYGGGDPWPVLTLQLGGALLCVSAGLLAQWPRERSRGYPFISLVGLLVLAATPLISIGGARQLVTGAILGALVVAFLWLERLPMRPGVGVAVMLGLALAGALPMATMADRDDPWFDYKAFAEGLGPDDPIRFNWDHDYGGITWGREGVEVMRVRAAKPSYWKVRTLSDFDGASWRDRGYDDALDGDAARDLPPDWEHRPQWTEDIQFMLRRLRTSALPGAGTTVDVHDASRAVRRGDLPGQWVTERSEMRGGDSFIARVHVPRPSPDELAGASATGAHLSANERSVRVFLDDSTPPPPDGPILPDGTPIIPDSAEIGFPPLGSHSPPVAEYFRFGSLDPDGRTALQHSNHRRTWELARRLRRENPSPYEYVLAVMRLLGDGYSYSELPPEAPAGVAPLEYFLFDTQTGYCQQFSGAMTLLLRMGGIPARVAAGFSPGGFSKKRDAWIVRDTDAHSWVEVWFDQYGWVAFDPTPPATPARSQIGRLAERQEDAAEADAGAGADAGSGPGAGADPARQPGTRGEYFSQPAPSGGDDGVVEESGGGGLALAWLPAALLLLGLAAWAAARTRRQRPATPLDRAMADLERALRRTGRPAPVGMTLHQLERRLGGSSYVRALRATRYGRSAALPTAAERRELRQELAVGTGRLGRLRALWALPPRLR